MTKQQIIQEAIDNKPFIAQIIQNLTSNKNDPFPGTGYTHLASPANAFTLCLCYEYSRHPQVYIDYEIRRHHENNIRAVCPGANAFDVLAEIPKEHMADLLPKYLLNKVKKAKSTYSADFKTLKFDAFAFAAFKQWVASQKKGLASTQALPMLQQIYGAGAGANWPIGKQYLQLIWDNTPKKSQELCKFYIDRFAHRPYQDLPIALLNHTYQNDIATWDPTLISQVSFGIAWYQRMVEMHQIPVSQAIMTSRHSEVYQWLTSVPKPTPLTTEGINITIDQIIVLISLCTIYPKQAPTFQLMLDTLSAELTSDKYTGVQALLSDRLTNITPIVTTLKALHDKL